MPTPGRLVLAPAVRAVAGTACSMLPLQSPTGLAPPSTLSQSRRGRPVSHAGRLPPRGLGLPLPEKELAAPGRAGSAKATPGQPSQHPKPQPVVCISREQPARAAGGHPPVQPGPCRPCTQMHGGRGALQTPAGVHLGCCCLPTAAAHGPAFTLLHKVSSLHNQNIPVCPSIGWVASPARCLFPRSLSLNESPSNTQGWPSPPGSLPQ